MAILNSSSFYLNNNTNSPHSTSGERVPAASPAGHGRSGSGGNSQPGNTGRHNRDATAATMIVDDTADLARTTFAHSGPAHPRSRSETDKDSASPSSRLLSSMFDTTDAATPMLTNTALSLIDLASGDAPSSSSSSLRPRSPSLRSSLLAVTSTIKSKLAARSSSGKSLPLFDAPATHKYRPYAFGDGGCETDDDPIMRVLVLLAKAVAATAVLPATQYVVLALLAACVSVGAVTASWFVTYDTSGQYALGFGSTCIGAQCTPLSYRDCATLMPHGRDICEMRTVCNTLMSAQVILTLGVLAGFVLFASKASGMHKRRKSRVLSILESSSGPRLAEWSIVLNTAVIAAMWWHQHFFTSPRATLSKDLSSSLAAAAAAAAAVSPAAAMSRSTAVGVDHHASTPSVTAI
ncbi:hypothetical protein BC831DRAFT_509508 [Entophlyctis helioformis]|nr:hypothetical protein BC831DRAFT_509508 [Entophlyctis helioformis]